jgi:hypothetical protein
MKKATKVIGKILYIIFAFAPIFARSEERRVGKEC